MRVEIPVFDGFDEIDVFGPFEVLSAAGFDVEIVAVEQSGQVTSMRGLRLAIDHVLGSPDVLLVPGGGWLNHAEEGAWAQAQRGILPQKLAVLATNTALVASVCTGSLLLASSGVLEGRYATTNRNALDDLRGFGVNVVEERVVDDGEFVTAGGLTAGIDLGLWIVERELGTVAADHVANSIEYTRQGRVWRSGAPK
jgi:transcriptional regulator GlxA family with amidase domain